MKCPMGRRECGELQLWSLVVVLMANLFTCNADYTLKTKKPILVNISTVLNPAFVRLEGTGSDNSHYVGLIPEILKSLKEKKAMPNYHIVKATDNEIGTRKNDGSWTGLMGHVQTITNKEHLYIGAGPILNIDAFKQDFDLSEPWATAYLTLVVKSSSVTNLSQALDSDMTIIAVKHSSELGIISKKAESDAELRKLEEKINQTRRFVDTLEQGLNAVKAESNTGVLTNSEEARYHVGRGFCDLRRVETSHSFGGFVFVFPRNDSTIERVNEQLKVMEDDGSLDRLRRRELEGQPGSCNRGGVIHLESVLAFLLVVSTFKSAQFMI